MDSDSASNARALPSAGKKKGNPPPPADGGDCVLREAAQRDLLQLYDENFPGLFRYANALTRDREQSKDAVQEAFLRYYASRVAGADILNGKAWLYTVLRNYVMDRFRESGTFKEVGIDALRDLPDESQSVQTGLRSARSPGAPLQSLSPRELDCLRLRAEGLRYREIGDVLGITSGTVSALLVRAAKKLRSAVDAEKRSK